MSRHQKNFSVAADAAIHAEALGLPAARVQQAKLLMATGQVQRALLTMDVDSSKLAGVEDSPETRLFYAKR